MTYPVDDAGNVRVDFVWGQMPMQPNQGRERLDNSGQNVSTDGNWTVTKERGSSNLDTGWTTRSFTTGDNNGTRYETYEYGYNDLATTGYSNYPAFIPNYAGDGDTGLEIVMPNLAGIPYSEWGAAISAAGLAWDADITTYEGATLANDGKFASQDPVAGAIVNSNYLVVTFRYAAPTVPNLVGLADPTAAQTALTDVGLVLGDTNSSTDGATALNDGKVKSQTVAAGTKVNAGSAVSIVVYDYVETVHTNIAGFSQASFPGHAALTGTDIYMFLTGRVTKPAVGNVITVASNTNSSLNRNYNVSVVEDNDSYNTGGTVVTLSAVDFGTPFVNPATNSGGTWIVA